MYTNLAVKKKLFTLDLLFVLNIFPVFLKG